MLRIFSFVIIMIILAACSTTKQPPANRKGSDNSGAGTPSKIALIYNDVGACPEDDCPEAAAEMARRAGLSVKFVALTEISPKIFEDAAVWIQPGGDSYALSRAFSNSAINAIKSFVARGGSYVGICAGAYFAANYIDIGYRGLNLTPGIITDYTNSKKATMMSLVWKGRLRQVYFEEGPYMAIKGPNVRVLATYPDGRAAAVTTTYGRGRVALVGPHPEAPEAWPKSFSLHDQDGPDLDLADELMDFVLRK